MAVTTYLQELINQKKALANNLVEKGIEANESEKFNTLVPKVLTIPTNIGLPIEVSSEEEMTEFLTSGEVGGIYKYIGETTETYENGSLYVLKGTEESDPLLGTWTLKPQDFDMNMVDTSLNSVGWDITATGLEGDEVITVSLNYLILNNVGFGYTQSSNGVGVAFPGEYPNILTLPYEYIISNAESNRWEEFSTFTINSVPDIDETNLLKILAFLQANATKQSTKQLSKEFVKLVIPTGTLDITDNAVYDVVNYANVNVNVNAEDSPIPIEVSTEAEMDELLVNGELNGVYKYIGETGTYEKNTLYIRVEPTLETSDGHYVVDSEGSIISLKVAEFIKLILRTDLEEITITENGEYVPIKEGYSKVTVEVDPTLEEITITENGEYSPSVDGYSKVTVTVPIPDGYIIPEGTIGINNTDEVDVTNYATAKVVDSNLIAENIVKDVTILGITGTFESSEDSPLPIEVSTEEEMTALLESGEVGGVYKYVGETTEVYENGTMYVLEALPDALAGTWVFNDLSMVYANGLTEGTGWLVNFVMDEIPTLTFMALEITDVSSTSDKLITLTGYTTNGRTGPLIDYRGGGYLWEAGISMTITSTLSEVENGDTLLAWLQINATKQ